MLTRSYTEMMTYESFGDRLNYLMLLDNNVNSPRHMSNSFYHSKEWLEVRDYVIKRDFACLLGVYGDFIEGTIIVHHINPITEEDILNNNIEKILNPDNLITVDVRTHNIIHYGYKNEIVERRPGDTDLW